MNKSRVRYPPSPTGYLHIGNARTALFNYLFAKKYNGDFIIRIEDTDLERNIADGVSSQMDNLKWLGIEWDESFDKEAEGYGPYFQLERHKIGVYQKVIDQLLENNKAYRCYCTHEELEIEAEAQKSAGLIPKYNGKCRDLEKDIIEENQKNNLDHTIRLRVPEDTDYTWNDIVKGNVTFNSKDVTGDFNLLKQNTIPTYNFAVVVDDYQMDITDVLRGEDHISNTPKQLMIYDALGWKRPNFGHMTLIVNQDGKKLSKRDTNIIQFIEKYKDYGYLPEALFNFIALLGWSPPGEEEIFSKDELIEMFTTDRLSKSSAKFDVNKLNWINNKYITKLTDNEYTDFVLPFLNNKYKIDNQSWAKEITLLYKEQMTYGKEIEELAILFFQEELILNDECKEFLMQDTITETLKAVAHKFDNIDSFNQELIKLSIKEVQKENQVKGKMIFMPIRIATTGQMHGPDLIKTIELLGKDKIIKNINSVINHIS